MVHGRSQQGKDELKLKKEWLDALAYGLARADKTLPAGTTIEFPYYGDFLAQLVEQTNTPLGAAINAKGPNPDGVSDADFRGEVLDEIARSFGLTDADIRRELSGPTVKGPANWEWVQAIMRAMDRIPGVNTGAIDLFTRDVFVYLTFPGVARKIDKLVDDAIGDSPCVVLAHSLGTVVAYNVLRHRDATLKCARLVTVGSPLGIRAIKRYLETPIGSPACVDSWFNAYDDRDFVALMALDNRNFDVIPPIENKSDVRNFTDNRHGIDGYLADPVVAAKVVEFL
jgi:pimeloyl-ACP methyl ester carboxylesterase